MTVSSLSSDQTDVLQEITNIAMGQAGDTLARVLNTFVTLSVPRIQLVEVTAIAKTLSTLAPDVHLVSAVRQPFSDRKLRGEAMVIFSDQGCNDLADLMGYEGILTDQTERELLIDVSNILIGGCLNGIAAQLELDFTYAIPTIMAEKTEIEHILTPEKLPWQYALLVEVHFRLEGRNFSAHLIILMTEEAIESLRITLAQWADAI